MKLSFRRSVFDYIMMLWYDLILIIESVNLVYESDQIIWSFCLKGVYSVQSLYTVIGFRRVQLVFIPSPVETDSST